MLCVNGEQLSPSAVLLLVLRCIPVEHQIGESVLRDNSKVTFHRSHASEARELSN